MTTDLRKTARKNRNYYLSQKKAEDHANPWFRYVKTMDSYSEPVLLSPKMAQELLETYDSGFSLRKPASPETIAAVAQGLKSEQCHKTVSISFSGKLIEGGNVLQAVVLNKESAIVFFAFNVSNKLSFLFG